MLSVLPLSLYFFSTFLCLKSSSVSEKSPRIKSRFVAEDHVTLGRYTNLTEGLVIGARVYRKGARRHASSSTREPQMTVTKSGVNHASGTFVLL